jgi:hypothetical protein
MLDQAFLEALRHLFWGLYLTAIAAGAVSVIVTHRMCLARAVFALAAASLAQGWLEAAQGVPLSWLQHMMIDVPVLVLITLPPRHYWQSTMGAIVFAQIVLHACWAMAPDLARWHWLGGTMLGLAKCLVLLGWSGGRRVEILLGRVARLTARLVPVARKGELAK